MSFIEFGGNSKKRIQADSIEHVKLDVRSGAPRVELHATGGLANEVEVFRTVEEAHERFEEISGFLQAHKSGQVSGAAKRRDELDS